MEAPLTPRIRIFAGPNGSGKSTLYAALFAEGHFRSLPFVNADEIELDLNQGAVLANSAVPTERDFVDFRDAVRRSGFMGVEAAAEALEWRDGIALRSGDRCDGYLAAAIASELRSRLVSARESFAFETVMSDARKIDFMQRAREQGYRLYLYFVSTGDVEINVERVEQRVGEGGHDVAEEKVRTRFVKAMELLPSALRHSDRAFLFDNAGPQFVLVASYDGATRELTLESEEIPMWVENLVSE